MAAQKQADLSSKNQPKGTMSAVMKFQGMVSYAKQKYGELSPAQIQQMWTAAQAIAQNSADSARVADSTETARVNNDLAEKSIFGGIDTIPASGVGADTVPKIDTIPPANNYHEALRRFTGDGGDVGIFGGIMDKNQNAGFEWPDAMKAQKIKDQHAAEKDSVEVEKAKLDMTKTALEKIKLRKEQEKTQTEIDKLAREEQIKRGEYFPDGKPKPTPNLGSSTPNYKPELLEPSGETPTLPIKNPDGTLNMNSPVIQNIIAVGGSKGIPADSIIARAKIRYNAK